VQGVAQPEEVWKLNSVFVTGGGPLPTATVSLTGPDGETVQDAAMGQSGPVEAIYKAIGRVVGIDIQLVDYQVKSITEGKDAMAHATVRIQSMEENGGNTH
jgi:2-isopropylmalate synthase